MDSIQLAQIIAEEILNTKGKDLKILDLRKLVSFTDYFVLVTGTSDRHVQAMADKVNLRLKKDFRRLPISFEGFNEGQWVLLDYGDLVLHIFQEEHREFYDLDGFWRDAPLVPILSDTHKAKSSQVRVKGKS